MIMASMFHKTLHLIIYAFHSFAKNNNSKQLPVFLVILNCFILKIQKFAMNNNHLSYGLLQYDLQFPNVVLPVLFATSATINITEHGIIHH